MPLICLYTAPLAAMRYSDVGDWHYSHKGLEIRVPRGLSDEETLLLMVHAGGVLHGPSRWRP
jgi:hypothetical protein